MITIDRKTVLPDFLRLYLPSHGGKTVVEMGWSGVKNGALLVLAGKDFDAPLTVDMNLPYQQNLTTLPVAVVALHAMSNELTQLVPLMPQLEATLAQMKLGSHVQVGA